MQNNLTVSLSPHVQDRDSVSNVMWTVNLALLPALLVSVLNFGIRVLAVNAAAVLAAVLTEYLVSRFMLKRESRISDGSAVLTGLLLAFNVPAGIPFWQVITGAVFAIGVAKMAFGGLGHNPFNPALAGRAFMLVSFPADMSRWPAVASGVLSWNVDAASSATPLARLAESGTADLPGYLDLFLGRMSGSMGEISALAILVGGIYLLWKKVISPEIPLLFLGTLALFTGIFWLIDPSMYADPLFHLLSGGAMLGAWFMATDMVTSPMTFKGRAVYAVSIGLLTGIIRLFGSYPEGVSYAILIMNAFTPIIDKYIVPRRFGMNKPAVLPQAPREPAGGEK